MGFFDFFKSKVEAVATSGEQEKLKIKQYTDEILKQASTTDTSIEKTKENLLAFAQENKLSNMQIRIAELEALNLFHCLPDSSVDFAQKEASKFAALVKAKKYYKILGLLTQLKDTEKKKQSADKWASTTAELKTNMNDAVSEELRGMLYIPEISSSVNAKNEDDNIVLANMLYNTVENQELSTFSKELLNIVYKNDEELYYVMTTDMMKKKTKTKTINYKGLTSSVKIMKGLHYRIGSLNVDRVKEEYWDVESRGQFWITNQRIGFLGDKSFSFPLNKIMSIDAGNEMLTIVKEGRQTPFEIYIPNNYIELPCAILSVLLNKN